MTAQESIAHHRRVDLSLGDFSAYLLISSERAAFQADHVEVESLLEDGAGGAGGVKNVERRASTADAGVISRS